MPLTTIDVTRLGLRHVLLLLAGGWCGPAAVAATFDLDLTADPDARFFEITSDAFAQLNQGFNGDQARDGFFDLDDAGGGDLDIGDESDFDAFSPSTFNEIPNSEGPDVFNREQDFSMIGSLEYDPPTGNVTSLTMFWDAFVAGENSLLNTIAVPLQAPTVFGRINYQTEFSNVSGSVSLVGGGVSAVDLTADVSFVYSFFDTVAQALIFESMDGVFRIEGDRFDLYVNDIVTFETNAGPTSVHNVWDIEGSVDNLATAPGDYNGDGSVDASDYLAWRTQYNTSVASGTGADGNGDGFVDAADYTVWRDNLPAPGAPTVAASPEPTALGVLLVGACLTAMNRCFAANSPPGVNRRGAAYRRASGHKRSADNSPRS